MKLAMAQIRVDADIARNLAKTIACMERAAEEKADIIFFPELQFTPFFPQYEKRDAEAWAMALDCPEITVIRDACRRLGLFASPNVYLTLAGHRYDASLVPLIFFSISSSIASNADTKQVGKLLALTIIIFVVTAAIAGIYMFLVTGIFGVDTSIQLESAGASAGTAADSIGDQIVNTFTSKAWPHCGRRSALVRRGAWLRR